MRVCDLLVCPLLAGKSLVGVLLFVHALGGRESGRVRDGVTVGARGLRRLLFCYLSC